MDAGAAFPGRLLRGLAKSSFIKDHDGRRHLTNEAFYPPGAPEQTRERRGKAPGFEISINFEDDPHAALQTTFADERNAGFGVCILPVSSVQNQPLLDPQIVWLEREPLPKNPFHGNIVLRSDTSQPIRRHIANLFAFMVDQQGECLSRDQMKKRIEGGGAM